MVFVSPIPNLKTPRQCSPVGPSHFPPLRSASPAEGRNESNPPLKASNVRPHDVNLQILLEFVSNTQNLSNLMASLLGLSVVVSLSFLYVGFPRSVPVAAYRTDVSKTYLEALLVFWCNSPSFQLQHQW